MSRVDKAALAAFLIALAVGYAAARSPFVRTAIEYARLPDPDDDRHAAGDTVRYLRWRKESG